MRSVHTNRLVKQNGGGYSTGIVEKGHGNNSGCYSDNNEGNRQRGVVSHDEREKETSGHSS